MGNEITEIKLRGFYVYRGVLKIDTLTFYCELPDYYIVFTRTAALRLLDVVTTWNLRTDVVRISGVDALSSSIVLMPYPRKSNVFPIAAIERLKFKGWTGVGELLIAVSGEIGKSALKDMLLDMSAPGAGENDERDKLCCWTDASMRPGSPAITLNGSFHTHSRFEEFISQFKRNVEAPPNLELRKRRKELRLHNDYISIAKLYL